jgi:hypothetical protein
MGVLLKVILFGLVIYYLLRTVGGIIFRLLGGQPPQQQSRQQTHKKREGEINIDYIPKDRDKRSSGSKREGDYIDYEEVK